MLNGKSYDEVKAFVPRGWYELTELKSSDRLEFVRDFWLETLPFTPHGNDALHAFFASLSDITIELEGERAKMSYHLSDKSGTFVGYPPIEGARGNYPEDFLSFFQIHNGFHKGDDSGLIPFERLEVVTQEFQAKMAQVTLKHRDQVVDPKLVTPFYQSFGREVYQCFYLGRTILCSLSEGIMSEKDLTFPSFIEWLFFYLEEAIDV